jgi:hypothetical protein
MRAVVLIGKFCWSPDIRERAEIEVHLALKKKVEGLDFF